MIIVCVGCKREHVESNALNNWKLKIFKIIDERVLFYSNNLDLLPPKPKLSFRYLKQGIQEFHRRYVFAPADKAANNVVVVCRLYYINTLKQELGSTKTYERTRDLLSIPILSILLLSLQCCLCYNLTNASD